MPCISSKGCQAQPIIAQGNKSSPLGQQTRSKCCPAALGKAMHCDDPMLPSSIVQQRACCISKAAAGQPYADNAECQGHTALPAAKAKNPPKLLWPQKIPTMHSNQFKTEGYLHLFDIFSGCRNCWTHHMVSTCI